MMPLTAQPPIPMKYQRQQQHHQMQQHHQQQQQQQQQIPEVILQTFMVRNVLVLKIRKGPQILYKLADNHLFTTLSPMQQCALTDEIRALHEHDMQRTSIAMAIANGNQASVPPEIRHQIDVKTRLKDATKKDHEAIVRPDYGRPFDGVDDALNRLVPYHIFDYPEEDFSYDRVEFEHQATLNAFNFDRRHRVINERMTDILRRCVSDVVPKEQRIMCDRIMLDEERLINQQLNQIYTQMMRQGMPRMLPQQLIDLLNARKDASALYYQQQLQLKEEQWRKSVAGKTQPQTAATDEKEESGDDNGDAGSGEDEYNGSDYEDDDDDEEEEEEDDDEADESETEMDE